MWQTDHAWRILEAFSPTPSVLLFVDIRLLSRQELGAATKVWESSMHLRWRWWSYLDLFGRHHDFLPLALRICTIAWICTSDDLKQLYTGHDGTGMIKTLKRSLSQSSAFWIDSIDSIDSHRWNSLKILNLPSVTSEWQPWLTLQLCVPCH